MKDRSLPISDSEVAQFREDTPGCEGRIFFNNAGASLQPKSVVERVIEHLRLEEEIGGYEAADIVASDREKVYDSVARLINAKSDEIAITESATRAWDMAFYGMKFDPGDRIVTAQNEYSSNYIAFLQMAKKSGAEIICAPANETGEVDIPELEKILQTADVKLVALTHIATNNGMIQPAAEVGKLTRRYGIPFLLDACQSVGQMHLDVNELGCDMLSATGRKFLRGPRGTGFLYVKRQMLDKLEPPFLDNHAAEWCAKDAYSIRPDARKFEAFESSAAVALGLGVAAAYAVAIGLTRIEARVQKLAARLREKLEDIEGIKVIDKGVNKSGIVIFIHDQLPATHLVSQLAEKKIVVRMSPRFGTRLDRKISALDDLVRASVHYYNTEEEIDQFCDTLAHLVSAL
jgi:selenocysteine lyase/cysteine desulfurase